MSDKNLKSFVQMLIEKGERVFNDSIKGYSYEEKELFNSSIELIEEVLNSVCLVATKIQFHYDNYIVETKYPCDDVQLKDLHDLPMYIRTMTQTGNRGVAKTTIYFTL